MAWPKHPDGTLKKPSEFTPEERFEMDRRVDARIEREMATSGDFETDSED